MDHSSEHGREAFERFLETLSSDKEASSKKYQDIRDRLVRYFSLRGVHFSMEAADETIDRVARKLDRLENNDDIVYFIFGFARIVALEFIRRENREAEAIRGLGRETGAEGRDRENLLLDYLKECLSELDQGSREMVLEYFSQNGKSLQMREIMAVRRDITLNNLRLKIFRVKKGLQQCVEGKKNGEYR